MAVFALVAYGLGLVGVVWFAIDSARIPSLVWFWSGYSRLGWWTTILVGLVAFGVPAFIVALAWRWSGARRSLLREVDELKRVASARRGGVPSSARNLA